MQPCRFFFTIYHLLPSHSLIPFFSAFLLSCFAHHCFVPSTFPLLFLVDHSPSSIPRHQCILVHPHHQQSRTQKPTTNPKHHPTYARSHRMSKIKASRTMHPPLSFSPMPQTTTVGLYDHNPYQIEEGGGGILRVRIHTLPFLLHPVLFLALFFSSPFPSINPIRAPSISYMPSRLLCRKIFIRVCQIRTWHACLPVCLSDTRKNKNISKSLHKKQMM